MKFKIFCQCLEAFRNNDFDLVERLLLVLDNSEFNPSDIALADKIRVLLMQKKLSLSSSQLTEGLELQEIAATKNNNYNQQVIVVVTPVYNAVKFIDETIASVISQRGEFTIRYHIQDGVLKS
jgi:hypothetical protein